MKDSIQINTLNEKYNMYLESAKNYERKNVTHLAKRNYLLSAECLMQIAKLSSAQLAKVKFDRAKAIIEHAETLSDVPPKPRPQSNVGGGKGSSSTEDGEGKKFISATIPDVKFSDIAGLDDVKEAIRIRMIYPFIHPEIYEAYGKKMGGGMLLYGPPGTGKTMIAKAIANEINGAFFAVKGSDIMSKWVGESEQNINNLFDEARTHDVSVIFIDEIDTLLGKRGQDPHNDKRVNEFLQQIDGFDSGVKNTKLLLLGATNRPWDIDSAAMRSGRFSEKIYLPLPDIEARRFLFNKNLKGVPTTPDVDIDWLCNRSDGYSGADITEVCDRAKIEPLKATINARQNNPESSIQPVTRADFERAFVKVRPSVTQVELDKLDEFAKQFNITLSPEEKASAPAIKKELEEIRSEEPAKPVDIVLPKEDKLKVIIQDKTLNLRPNEPTPLEFYLDGEFRTVYAKINSKNYVCKQNIRNWIIDDIEQPEGEYTVEITADGKKTSFEIRVIRGIDEIDYDI